MKIVALALNIVLLIFTFIVHLTDGMSKEILYIIFSLWMFLTPVFTIIIILRDKNMKNIELGAIVANIILIGSVCWALLDQYPHPAEPGFIEYVVLIFLTPIVSIVTLARKRNINKSFPVQAA